MFSTGYYADIGARCQVFRICANTANNTAKGFAFLCPNGTLFNQGKTNKTVFVFNNISHSLSTEFFVCDWYRNVNCENSENFYKLNELIGKTMDSSTKNELMNSAREIIMFPKQTPNFNTGDENIYNNYPSEMGSSLGINGGTPSRGSSNLGQPTGAVGSLPYNPSSSSSPSGVLPGGSPNRGANGGTVYVNSLGQLSTDKDAGFDPKHSFILKPDKDSQFEQDLRIPSDSFDTIKGIGNSYSFGFPDGSNAPIRGSADLSEPVDPYSVYGKEEYLPPHLNGQNPKQLYTYPHDAQSHGPHNVQGILPPEFTGQLNNKLAAHGPKYQAPEVYGPALTPQSAPQKLYQTPKSPNQSQSQSSQPRLPFKQQQANSQTPSTQSQPQRFYQQPNVQTPSAQSQPQRFNQQPNSQAPSAQSQPQRLYQQPNAQKPSAQSQPQRFNQHPNSQTSAAQNQPQRFNQQPKSQTSAAQNQPQRFNQQQQTNTAQGQPQRLYQQPNVQTPSALLQPQRFNQQPNSQTSAAQPQPSRSYLQPNAQSPSAQSQPSRTYLQPAQNAHNFQQNQNQNPQNNQQQNPTRLYQQPNNNHQHQAFSQQPQPFRVPQAERRQFNAPQNNQNTNRNGYQSQPSNGNRGSGGNGQSNEEYLHGLLRDQTHVHNDKGQLVELIQRLFVPASAETRVVSADVIPSPAKESYSFTYDEDNAGSNTNSKYQPANSGYHQHTGTSGHTHQGYIY